MISLNHKKSVSRKVVILLIVCVFIIGAVSFFIVFNKPVAIIDKNTKTPEPAASFKSPKKQDRTIHLAAMGDMLAHDTIIANAKAGDGYDFTKFFTNILPSYKNADIIFCNQEGLSSGESFGVSGYPSFNAPSKFASDLKTGARCNMINLANNHMGDKGVAATNATIDVWSGLKPFAISGANKSANDQGRVDIAEINGIKVGFVAFADFNNNKSTPAYGVNNYHDAALVQKLVTMARSKADVVIVSMHWGVEDSNMVSADQRTQAENLSSLGVDLVIGTGPHVLQTVESISRSDGGKTIVWYSLGNMLSSQLNIKELIGGIAQMDIIKAVDGKVSIKNLSLTPTYMHYEWTAAQSASGDLLARKNAMIYTLAYAANPLSRSLFNTSVAEQKQYVIDTLGQEVSVK